MGGTDSETLTISVGNVNRPPVLQAIGNQVVNEQDTLTLVLSATDLDGDELVYLISDAPEGSSLSENKFSCITFGVLADWPRA